MLIGILSALLGGAMLGLYACGERYLHDDEGRHRNLFRTRWWCFDNDGCLQLPVGSWRHDVGQSH